MPARRKRTTKPVRRRTPAAKGRITSRTKRSEGKTVRPAVLARDGLGIASTRDTVSSLSDIQARDLALCCRDAAVEKKAEDVRMLDIRDRAGFADYFILATGRSVIQARAVADSVVEAGEGKWGAPLRTEGYNDGSWILVDYGPVIVHVFTPQAREFYDLERLWGKPAPQTRRRQG